MRKLVRITPRELVKKYSEGERDFRYTKLRGKLEDDADLGGIITSGSDWSGVRMISVYIADSVNVGTDFSKIYAPKADFSDADNRRASFDRTVLDRADFDGSDVRRASFGYAKGLEKHYYEINWRGKRAYFPPFTDCKVKGVTVDGLPWDVVFNMIRTSADVNGGNLILCGLPVNIAKLVFSIDFHYIHGTMDEKKEAIRKGIESDKYPADDVKDSLPFYEISRELWNLQAECAADVEPVEKVTKGDIKEVEDRILKFAGLKRSTK